MFSATQSLTVAILTVIDAGPRHSLDSVRQRFLRPPIHHQPISQQMLDAETEAAHSILNAGLEYMKTAETLLRQGRPELEIVNAAAEWRADVILVCARAEYGEPPTIGPHSVGHVARFVLDHAPCPVLLVRPLAREQFPITR
jgi:nucleotide-binding universal stress UspA family protein